MELLFQWPLPISQVYLLFRGHLNRQDSSCKLMSRYLFSQYEIVPFLSKIYVDRLCHISGNQDQTLVMTVAEAATAMPTVGAVQVYRVPQNQQPLLQPRAPQL